MLFFLPLLITPAVFLFCRGFLKDDNADAALVSFLSLLVSAFLFMFAIPAIATSSNDDWRVQVDSEIQSEIQITEEDDRTTYSFWADGRPIVIDTYNDTIELMPVQFDSDIVADKNRYTVLCDTTPGIFAPFHYAGCDHRISLVNPLED